MIRPKTLLRRLGGPAVFLLLAACHHPTAPRDDHRWDGGIVGSGRVIEESRDLIGVRGVSLHTVAELRIVQGGQESLRIRGEDNIVPHLLTEVSGGVLRIRFPDEPAIHLREGLQIELTVLDLDLIERSGVGDIELSQLSTGHLELIAGGVGDVQLRGLDLGSLDVIQNGVGDVDAAGVAEQQRVRISGVGHYRADSLSTREADVSLHSPGSATVRVHERLYALVTGSGTVYYYGDPIVEAQVTGSGSVERLGG